MSYSEAFTPLQPKMIDRPLARHNYSIQMIRLFKMYFQTPPVASNLFVAQSMTGLDVVGISKKALPFMAVLIISMIIAAFVPAVSMGILSLFG